MKLHALMIAVALAAGAGLANAAPGHAVDAAGFHHVADKAHPHNHGEHMRNQRRHHGHMVRGHDDKHASRHHDRHHQHASRHHRDDARAMGAGRAFSRDDFDARRRARMDEAYANWLRRNR